MSTWLRIGHPASRLVEVRYHPLVVPFQDYHAVAATPAQNLVKTLNFDLRRKPHEEFRWRITTNASKGSVPVVVVRTRLKRRWRGAFMEVMRERGFETNSAKRGWAVDPARPERKLRGTLDITVKEGYGLKEDYEELLRVAGGMMLAVESKVLTGESQGFNDAAKHGR